MSSLVQGGEINAGNGLGPTMPDLLSNRRPLVGKFIKFCLVGGSGVVVDMGVLFLLADSHCLGLNIMWSKICAAEAAMINNFIWNELWTFKGSCGRNQNVSPGHLTRRFLLFNAICGIGICLAVLLLHLFHAGLGWNLYLSNFGAIVLVTFWNFALNYRWNWTITK